MPAGMTYKEHLAWCKERAMKYIELGQPTEAFTSMASDLEKHPETKDHPGKQLGMMMLVAGHLSTPEKMREFIQGFR